MKIKAVGCICFFHVLLKYTCLSCVIFKALYTKGPICYISGNLSNFTHHIYRTPYPLWAMVTKKIYNRSHNWLCFKYDPWEITSQLHSMTTPPPPPPPPPPSTTLNSQLSFQSGLVKINFEGERGKERMTDHFKICDWACTLESREFPFIHNCSGLVPGQGWGGGRGYFLYFLARVCHWVLESLALFHQMYHETGPTQGKTFKATTKSTPSH